MFSFNSSWVKNCLRIVLLSIHNLLFVLRKIIFSKHIAQTKGKREANVLFTLKQSWPMYSISFLRVSCTGYQSTVVIDTLALMSQTDPLPNSVLCPKIFLDSGSFSLLNLPNQALVMFHYLISLIQALPVVILVVLCFLSFSSLFCSSHCSQNDCFKR